MKINRYIFTIGASLTLMFGLQSCFQDLDQDPSFNYPEQPAPPAYNALKVFLPFDENTNDQSVYEESTKATNITLAEGIQGKAYQGASNGYLLITSRGAGYPGDINPMDSIANLGSFTLSYWMNAEKVDGATGIFSISNTKSFWGNLDIFLEGNGSDTEAFFKIYMQNATTGTDTWVTRKVENVFKKWSHLVFQYNGETSIFSIYLDGEKIFEENKNNFGPLKFKDVGSIVLGTLQFQTVPSLTSGAEAQDWAKSYVGKLDQVRFYNKVLSQSEITQLFSDKQ